MDFNALVKKINVPMSILIAFVGVFLFKEVTIGASILGVGLCALFAFNTYMQHIKKADPSQEIFDEINKLKGAINVIKLGYNIKTKEPENKPTRYF